MNAMMIMAIGLAILSVASGMLGLERVRCRSFPGTAGFLEREQVIEALLPRGGPFSCKKILQQSAFNYLAIMPNYQ